MKNFKSLFFFAAVLCCGVANGQVSPTLNHMNAWSAILDASPIVQMVLLTLVGMSVICWAILLQKRKLFRFCRQANTDFLNFFWKANSLDEVYAKLREHDASPLAQVFRSGFMELQKIADASRATDSKSQINLDGAARPQLIGIENFARALRKASDIQIASLESRLGFLATTGSTGPFIGLFGTVWGIMNAFQKIGNTGQASLAVVAPGISEALIATAIGLATAIPAVVAYNHFVSQVKREELEISNFSSDLMNVAKRNFFRED